MRLFRIVSRRALYTFAFLSSGFLCGCESLMKNFSDNLTHWNMLGQEALEDPIKAVGGPNFDPKAIGCSRSGNIG
jgi:hypothetical protein